MNPNPLVQQIIDQRAIQDQSLQASEALKARDASNHDKLFTMLALYFDHLIQEIQDSVLKADIQNLPEDQRVSGTVSIEKAESIEIALDALVAATIANRPSSVDEQRVSGSVEVTNFPTPKEVKIPEYPKQIKTEVVSLPKYVGEKLDALKAAFTSLPTPQVNVAPSPAPEVHVDMEGVINQLQTLQELLTNLNKLGAEEQPLDLSPLVGAMEDVKKTITEIKFPIPNFQSSYAHSKYMQSLDGDMTYHNTTISTPSATDGSTTHRAVDYMEVTLGDGTYRQTFTYNAYGEVATKTGWVKQ